MMVVMMLMLVIVVIVMMVVMVLMLIIIVVIIVMVMMMMAAAIAFFIIVIMVMVVMLVGKLLHGALQAVFIHGSKDLLAGDGIPGRGDHATGGIQSAQHFHSCDCFGFVCCGGPAEDNEVSILHLIVEELTEVAHIHFAFVRINHGHLCTDFDAVNSFHGLCHVRQLADAGGLDDNTVRRIFFYHLLEGLAEVTHQRAADAAGVHLGNFNAGILEEGTVNGDITELVFNENQLFTLVAFRNQFADECCFACAEKT